MAAKVKEEISKIKSLVKVELKELVLGIQTLFHGLGSTEFNDGKAEVTTEVANVLKDAKVIK